MYPILSTLESILDKKLATGSTAGWGWGWRIHPITRLRSWHNGVDLGAPIGTPIYAPWSGKVIEAWNDEKTKNLNGNAIRINHKEFAPGNIVETAYAHLDAFHVSIKNGAFVKQGQIIGYVGNTGQSTGPHLHFIIKVNPPIIIEDNSRSDIDPLPHLLDSVKKKSPLKILGGLLIAYLILRKK
jgi:murein DD-endopeptidase MepM/ murein hydrolase activator NlpD